MKIAIVGAGAMGSLFGALIAESDQNVWLPDIRFQVRSCNDFMEGASQAHLDVPQLPT